VKKQTQKRSGVKPTRGSGILRQKECRKREIAVVHETIVGVSQHEDILLENIGRKAVSLAETRAKKKANSRSSQGRVIKGLYWVRGEKRKNPRGVSTPGGERRPVHPTDAQEGKGVSGESRIGHGSSYKYGDGYH